MENKASIFPIHISRIDKKFNLSVYLCEPGFPRLQMAINSEITDGLTEMEADFPDTSSHQVCTRNLLRLGDLLRRHAAGGVAFVFLGHVHSM